MEGKGREEGRVEGSLFSGMPDPHGESKLSGTVLVVNELGRPHIINHRLSRKQRAFASRVTKAANVYRN